MAVISTNWELDILIDQITGDGLFERLRGPMCIGCVHGAPEVSTQSGCDLYVRWSFSIKRWLQFWREGASRVNPLISFMALFHGC